MQRILIKVTAIINSSKSSQKEKEEMKKEIEKRLGLLENETENVCTKYFEIKVNIDFHPPKTQTRGP